MERYLLLKDKLCLAYYLLFTTLYLSLPVQAQKEAEKIKSYLQTNAKTYHLSANDLKEMSISSAYRSPTTGWYHVYYNQVYQSIEVFNGMLNVTYANNDVAHVGNTFVEDLPAKIEGNNTFTQLSPANAIDKVAGHLNLPHKPYQSIEESSVKLANGQVSKGVFRNSQISDVNIPVKLYWLPYQQNGAANNQKVALVWNVLVSTKDHKHLWSAHVDAVSGEVLEIKDQVIHCDFGPPNHTHKKTVRKPAHSNLHEEMQHFRSLAPNSYNVFDIPIESPSHGNRSIVTNPYTRFTALGTGPGATNGWHDDSTTTYTTTRGNNVLAKEDNDGNNETVIGASPSSASLNFDYAYTHGVSTATANRDAAITNLFYWNNLIHDVLWKYGFDEPSGNFQKSNMGRGGLGNDYILADAQDGSRYNNARFYSDVDGVLCRIEMYLWYNSGSPAYQPDGDFDNGIISHEYGHGWSIRLTGGPATATCLYNAEQPGEGWSDYLGLMLTTNWSGLTPTVASANIVRGIGTYVLGEATTGDGFRPYPYSYDMVNVNGPTTYSKVDSYRNAHGIGSIWATALWDMTWEIIFQDNQIVGDIYNTTNMVGNIAALKLVNEGLRLQPCNPNFIEARDAILKADMLLFNGRYSCAIWRAFARRGVGVNASTGASSDDFTVVEDFTPVTNQGWVMSSPTVTTACSHNVFNYTAIASGATVYRWSRAAVDGISNAAASGNTSIINETLINTTNDPIDVIYQFSFAPGSCQVPIDVRVTVNPSPKLSVADYAVCQNSTVPSGEGLVATFEYTNTVTGKFVAGNPTYRRSSGNNSTVFTPAPFDVYLRTHTFTPLSSGPVSIETIGGALSGTYPYHTFLALYQGSFNKYAPNTNFLIGDDDSGALPYASKITYNLTAGTTYVLVVSPANNGVTGNYQIQATAHIFGNPKKWYHLANGGGSLVTGEILNPVGIPSSEIPDTFTPTSRTYYVGTPDFSCRTPGVFSVTPTTAGGSVTGSATVCTNTNIGELTLNGNNGTILRWESSTNNFVNITEINNTTNSYTYNNLAQTTQFRVVSKNGVCSAANSVPGIITKSTATLPLASNYEICRRGTIPVGQGMAAPISSPVNVVSGMLVAGSSTYWRGMGNNITGYVAAPSGDGNTVHYKTHIIKPVVSGVVSIETIAASLNSPNPADTYLTLYFTSFNPAAPATNFLMGDDDSGTLIGASKITFNLTAGNTYILVVSTHPNNISGAYQLLASDNVFKTENSWYLTSSGGTAIGTGDVFNPVGVAGSGITNTNATLQKTFYVASPDFGTCRIPIEFAVKEVSNSGSVSGGAPICSGSLSGTLTLSGHSNRILWWESSTNSFANITTIASTDSSISYTNLTETTEFRAMVYNSGCPNSKSRAAVIVKLTTMPTATDYAICQDGTVPGGQGLILSSVNSGNSNKLDGILTADSPLYCRGQGSNPTTYIPAGTNNGSNVHYQTHIIKTNVSGLVSIEVMRAVLSHDSEDTFISLYQNSFNPNDPATNFLIGNDDKAVGTTLSKISYNLTAGTTYILVVCPYNDFYKGFYRLQATANVFDISNNIWFENNSANTPLTTGNVFNPVGFSGSGIPNTATPLTKTFYVGSLDFKVCRTPATFSINPYSIGGSIAGSTLACTNTNSGTLTLSGQIGSIVRWESSTDNFSTINQIANTTPTQTYNNLTQATQYRAVIKSGACDAVHSGLASISRTLPTSPVAPAVSRCGSGAITLTATGCTSGTPNWYSGLTGGAPLATGSSFNIANLTEPVAYYVGCVLNLCTSDRQYVLATPNINMIYDNPEMSQQAGNYRASQTIISSNNVGSGVNYFAGKSITLSPGFQAGGNEVFTARIEGCP